MIEVRCVCVCVFGFTFFSQGCPVDLNITGLQKLVILTSVWVRPMKYGESRDRLGRIVPGDKTAGTFLGSS